MTLYRAVLRVTEANGNVQEVDVDVEIADLDSVNWSGDIVGARPVVPGWDAGDVTVLVDRRMARASVIPEDHPTEHPIASLVGLERFSPPSD